MSSPSDHTNQSLIGWRGVEFLVPSDLRLTAERIGPRSAYSIFSDKGYPRVELIVDRSRSYDGVGVRSWVDRMISGKSASKWEDVKISEGEMYGHKALRITGRVEDGRFIAYAWSCSGVLNFVKLNLRQGDEQWTEMFRSLRCHRADGMMLLRLYEFQVLAPHNLWISSISSTTGVFSLVLEDDESVVVIERAGPVEALGVEIHQWLRKFHAKRLEKYRVYIGSEPRGQGEEHGHEATAYPIHPKGLAIRRKTIGLTETWVCDLNKRYWALSRISFSRRTDLSKLPKMTIDCHAKRL